MPDISIVIPCYNVEKYINQCLDSVLAQTLEDVEIICIDDASEDMTGIILDQYALNDGRIRIIKNEYNIGLSGVRNRGIELAIGKYIYFLDSDDYLISQNALQIMFDAAERIEAEIICFGSETVDERNTDKSPNCFSGKKCAEYPEIMSGAESYLALVKNGEYLSPVWMYIYSLDFVKEKKLRFIENSCSEDISFTFDAHVVAERVGVINDILYCYRLRDNSQIHCERHIWRVESAEGNVEHFLSVANETYIRNALTGEMFATELQLERDFWKRRFSELNYDEKIKYVNSFSSNFIKRLFVNMVLNSEPYIFPDNVIYELRQKHVILYGAGHYAKKYIYILENYDIHIEGIVVTEGSMENLFGYCVKKFASWIEPPGTVCIPAVSGRYKQDVIRNIRSRSNLKLIDMEDFCIDNGE